VDIFKLKVAKVLVGDPHRNTVTSGECGFETYAEAEMLVLPTQANEMSTVPEKPVCVYQT
jgi:hypothetical protein